MTGIKTLDAVVLSPEVPVHAGEHVNLSGASKASRDCQMKIKNIKMLKKKKIHLKEMDIRKIKSVKLTVKLLILNY